jgi:16S rRNA (cytosine1402-N4)-methyltransferase
LALIEEGEHAWYSPLETEQNTTATDLFGNIQRPLEPVNRKVIVPNKNEIVRNSRARSAKLRIAEKLT